MFFNCNSVRPIDILEAATVIFLTAGIKGNQLAIALDNVFKSFTGKSALDTAGIHLETTAKEKAPFVIETVRSLTPSEIAKAFGLSGNKKSTKTINEFLEYAGFQERLKGKNNWTPTEKGKKFAVLIDTGKKYPDGSQILQLKWTPEIVSIIQELIPF